jgi:sulfate adenylyltransferase (ADP) / ATP adenylyltransferase
MADFPPGKLWQQVVAAQERALLGGALQPIPADVQFVEDGGVRFVVRLVELLRQKPRGSADPVAAPRPNPFLPYDPKLYVADAGSSHVCLLNKFNVVDHHLLIVTREFEHQEMPLSRADFEVWWRCLAEYPGLGFYNGGTLAGASQPHKHLQLVPLPLADRGPGIPLEPLLAVDDPRPRLDASPALPFQHATAGLTSTASDSPEDVARHLEQLYREMLRLTGLSETRRCDGRLSGAYNLLITRQWMLLVPRRQEDFASISLNALAFAGALLTWNRQQFASLRWHGPMKALQHVAVPKRGQRTV